METSTRRMLIDDLLARVGKTRADFDLRSKIGAALCAEGVPDSPEVRRVLELPRRQPTPDARELLSLELCPSGREHLWDLQTLALLELCDLGGALGGLGCGDGKTLCTASAPILVGAKRPLLVVPGGLRRKTIDAFADLRARGWRTADLVPFKPEHRRMPPPPGTVILISYQQLAVAANDGVLFDLCPDLIELDEAHKIAQMNAAAKRLNRYIEAHRPRVMVLSGTWLSAKLERVHHFCRWVYRDHPELMPLPRTLAETKTWGRAIDEPSPDSTIEPLDAGALSKFGATPAALRDGFGAHLRSTPGCIGSTDASCGASIVACVHVPQLSAACVELIRVMQTGVRPDDVELEPHMQAAGEVQAALGFWYGWEQPGPEPWMLARRQWGRFERAVTLSDLAGFDTHLQIWRQYGLGGPLEVPEGRRWGEIQHTFKPVRTTNWVDTSQLEQAIELAHSGDPCLIWTDIVAVGEKLAELGVPYYGQRGLDSVGRYVEAVEDGSRTVALSLAANCEGRDQLKRFRRLLFLTPLPNARTCEQAVSRVHRPGQTSDEIEIIVWAPTDRYRWRIEAARAAALEAQQKSGQRQRLLLADWIDE